MLQDFTELALDPNADLIGIDPASIPEPELRRLLHRLALFYRLAQDICSESDHARVFSTILAAVARMLPVERGFIATVDSERLVPRAQHNIALSGPPEQWPVSSTMLARVLESGTALLTFDALTDPSFGQARSVDIHNIRSVMCCPLRGARGLIYVDNRLVSGAFSAGDLTFFNALSHFAALAVVNAQNLAFTNTQRERAEAMIELLRGERPADITLIGHSQAIRDLCQQARLAARKDIPILLVGETGTGKEVFARLIHTWSPRGQGPFVAVNLSALPASTIESELFGHEKGSFTGAVKHRHGRFELAEKGTLFLDEILDVPPEVQPKLLRVLEQRTFERLGSNEALQFGGRILCACNRDPAQAVAEGRFRQDLLYRLNAVSLRIPPLRERREDIMLLMEHFLRHCGSTRTFEPDAVIALESYDWPGNVRELRNCAEAIDAMVCGPRVRKDDLPGQMREGPATEQVRFATRVLASGSSFVPLAQAIAELEKAHFQRALHLAGGNNEKALKLLGISRATFYQRKRTLGL